MQNRTGHEVKIWKVHVLLTAMCVCSAASLCMCGAEMRKVIRCVQRSTPTWEWVWGFPHHLCAAYLCLLSPC